MNGHVRSATVIEFAQFVSERFVHERVDDRISDVVGEVHVEDGHAVGDELQSHEEGRQVGDDEDDSDDEQDSRRLQVGDAVLLPGRQRPPLCLRRAAVQARGLDFPRQVVVLVGDGNHCDYALVAIDRHGGCRYGRRVVLPRRSRHRLNEGRCRPLLSLSSDAARQHRAVDEDVQHENDDEAGEVHGCVELLEEPLEVAAEDHLGETTVPRVGGCRPGVVWRRRRVVNLESQRQHGGVVDNAVHEGDQHPE